MSGFLSSAIGKKFLMSISGFFLMLFLIVHLIINLLLLADTTGATFNIAAHFMRTNPLVKIIEPLLAIGFLVHICYSFIISITNWRARPIKYEVNNPRENSTWISRNMIYLGILILLFLIMHVINFFWKLRFGEIPEIMVNGELMENTYSLVSGLFINYWWYDVLYILGAIFLGLHLTHGFWSAFQTIGLDNTRWKPRLKGIGIVYTIIITGGFSIIPIYFLIKSYL
ncbi:MAG TPA: succinate dehydrogenase [Bacteroidales bacterium]|nr:succinate dehydrogenase [Bacteroidales bacterium]